jgi:tRNA threonylcarbamoyladenosine modification (KEOPS) complex  Pcc1 subunit
MYVVELPADEVALLIYKVIFPEWEVALPEDEVSNG